MIQTLLDFILHIDVHLAELAAQYGAWIYGLLFLIVFCETGLVVTPFLPGDSLLFAAGGIAAVGGMNVHVMVLLLFAAAAQRIRLTTIGILQYLSPSLQFLLGLTAFHEPFSRMQFAGYLWVWAGVALFVWGARKTQAT